MNPTRHWAEHAGGSSKLATQAQRVVRVGAASGRDYNRASARASNSGSARKQGFQEKR